MYTEYEEYRLVRLFDTSTNHIIQHFTELPETDIRLRFGYNPSVQNISTYVQTSIAHGSRSRTDADFWFGIKLGVALVATMHIAIRGETAEFAFTTDKNHRGKKLGQLLFARGYQMCSEYSISKIYMTCLAENAPMRHIARKFGLIVNVDGREADSSITIPHHVPMNNVDAIKMTIMDK